MGSLDVLSCGTDLAGLAGMSGARAVLRDADVIFGSRPLIAACERFLANVPAGFPASVPAGTAQGADGPAGTVGPAGRSVRERARIVGGRAREDAAEALRLYRMGRRVALLASGDALYHGLGGTLADLAASLDPDERAGIRFWPNITAFQTLFHRLGLPWDGARLFSAHDSAHDGGEIPLRRMAEAPFAVIYGGSRYPAHALAAALAAFHPSAADRPAVLADRLGTDTERIIRGRVEELATAEASPTSFLVLLPPPADATPPILALGLPESAYERERNLITPGDARAVILSRLRLPAWGVLWDVGAGSGSVGLEAAALRPDLRVIAFERQADRAAMIRRNAARLGVANHETREGSAPEILPVSTRPAPVWPASPRPTPARPALPRPKTHPGTPPADEAPPDRIFIGGSGGDLQAVLDACFTALRPGGLLAVSAVTLESVHVLHGWRPEARVGLCTLDIAVEAPLAGAHRHLRPQRRLTLYVFGKFEQGCGKE